VGPDNDDAGLGLWTGGCQASQGRAGYGSGLSPGILLLKSSAACPVSSWTPGRNPRRATNAATAMITHMPKSTSRVALAKSARMNAGVAAGLRLPPCWANLAACAEAAGPGRPRAVSEEVTADRWPRRRSTATPG